MENLSLSVPDLLQVRTAPLPAASPPPGRHMALCARRRAAELRSGLFAKTIVRAQTVKNFVTADKHEALDEMLKRYTSKQLGKQQVIIAFRLLERDRGLPPEPCAPLPRHGAADARPGLRDVLGSCNSSCAWSPGATRCARRSSPWCRRSTSCKRSER